jgi:Ca2+-binding EF-hand superfamily protein
MRFMMKKLTIFAGASVFVLAAAAYAAPMMGKMKMDVNGDGNVTQAEAASVADARFAKMDADGNGMIDQTDKAARVKARFADIDADKNGAVTEAEFIAADAARQEKRMARRAENGDSRERRSGRGDRGRGGRSEFGSDVGRWGQADSNGDKAISRAEFDAAGQARFAAKDKDSDGILTKAEIQSARQEMRGAGRGKRGAGTDAG